MSSICVRKVRRVHSEVHSHKKRRGGVHCQPVMAEYAAVRRGKLKLKGNSGSLLGHKKKKVKRKKEDADEEWMKEPGAVRHGMHRYT